MINIATALYHLLSLVVPIPKKLPYEPGSLAFLQSARIDLDKACETARKKTVGDNGGAASVLMGRK